MPARHGYETAATAGAGGGLPAERADDARREMLEEIQATVEATAAEIGRRVLKEAVMQALSRVPRHQFVPVEAQPQAYFNRPLPIGHAQTISQPYIVALMTDLMEVSPDAVVLEVGAGSGYQAAVLAELVREVHSIEIVPALVRECRARMQRLGYANVTVHEGDGYYGLEEKAPFDAIMVTAAATCIPPPLVRQLKPGGRLVMPVGAPGDVQTLMLVVKNETGEVTVRPVLPVVFVPLTGARHPCRLEKRSCAVRVFPAQFDNANERDKQAADPDPGLPSG